MFQINQKYHCGGAIIFNDTYDHVVMVKDSDTNIGFPKGKRNKNETQMENALRELNEETGFIPSNISFINDFYLVEINEKGNPVTCYLVGKYKGNYKEFDFTYDIQELKNVFWASIDDAHKVLYKRRSIVLTDALNKIKDTADFIDGKNDVIIDKSYDQLKI